MRSMYKTIVHSLCIQFSDDNIDMSGKNGNKTRKSAKSKKNKQKIRFANLAFVRLL